MVVIHEITTMHTRRLISAALTVFTLLTHSPYINAQFTQHVRGTVVEQLLGKPVAGATITLVSLSDKDEKISRSVLTGAEGTFKFPAVSIGEYRITISHIGFREAVVDNIEVISGKEKVISQALEVIIKDQQEVVVTAESKRNKALNDLSAVSARAFTVEETQNYAAAVNDPLRMATGFPGVVAANDGNNDIVIRGNSPAGLLWRMEGIEIPNPNHFSNVNSSGGGISILSAQLLANSDFVTGAFAAEYGNALSGVFDLKLRKGNNERKEYMVQAGLLGLNLAAEGPFSKGSKSSYLVNYRYSTLQLLSKLGFNLTQGSTNFQDLSYNIYLPTSKAGTFTLFGFTGFSGEIIQRKKDSSQWKSKGDRYNRDFVSNTAVSSLTHNISIGNRSTLKSAIALSYNHTGFDETYIEDDYSLSEQYKEKYKTKKWVFSSTLNHKVSTRSSLRTGVILQLIHHSYYLKARDSVDTPLKEKMNTNGNTQTVQSFAQWHYRASDRFAVSAGLHYLALTYNSSHAIEPRASLKWEMNRRNTIALGYGRHSQLQGLGVYFATTRDASGTAEPNRNLGFTKAHHFVISHSYLLAKNMRLKTELYYQHLFNVPVSTNHQNTFSTLNIVGDYVTQPLINKGRGRNYGIEVSAEKYLSNNFYYTISSSFYQSKYTAADDIERNTRFNGNYVNNLIAGKEFISADKRRTFGINIKSIYAGGFRTTPIDAEQSSEKKYTVFRQKEAFSIQNPAYFRTDLRASIKWNRRQLTSTLSLDIQNVSNRLNVYGQVYNAEKNIIEYTYQNGLIPILNYKVEF
jgi:hypothetical protein